MYLIYRAKIELHNDIISDNTAKETGGAIFCGDSILLVSSSTQFENNNAKNGSDLYCSPYPKFTVCQVISNNTKITTCPEPHDNGGNPFFTTQMIILLSVLFGSAFVFFVVGGCFVCYRKRKAQYTNFNSHESTLMLDDDESIN